jgi:hypothetical protein
VRRRLFQFACVFALGFALCWIVSHRKGSDRGPAPEVQTITLHHGPDAQTITLDVVQTKRAGSPVQAPKTEPEKTWVITLGKFGDPEWVSYVATVR